jgi:predicted nucleotidyltransferase
MDEPTIEKVREALAREPGVACALVFGSRARGIEPRSHVDLGIVGRDVDRPELAARLSRLLGFEVDVVDLDEAWVPLLRTVLEDAVPVASNVPGALGDFYSRAYLTLDLDGPLYDRMVEGRKAALARGNAPL